MSSIYYDFSKQVVLKATEDMPRHSEASVLELEDGSLLMAWQCHIKSEYGAHDKAPSTVSLANSRDFGKTWENQRIAAKMIEGCVNVYSPTLFRNADGSISLYFKRYMQLDVGKPILNNYYKITSYDEGNTWSKEETIWENRTSGTHNHSIKRLRDGAILIPTTFSKVGHALPNERFYVSVLRSEDDGKSFTSSNEITVPMRGLMEPCIAERADGSLNMVMRTQLGSVFYSKSFDGGKTWTKPQTTGLQAPESCPCIVSIPDSDAQLVIWNNAEYDMFWSSHYGKRTPLTMAISRDGLKTFTDFFDIETDPGYAFTNPSVTVTKNGLFIVNYWSSKYNEQGFFGGTAIDLNIATFRIKN